MSASQLNPMDNQNDLNSLDSKTAITLLLNGQEETKKLFDKMDVTLSSVNEMCYDLKRIISLHDQSITELKKNDSKQNDILDHRLEKTTKEIHLSQIKNAEEASKTREYVNLKISEMKKEIEYKVKEDDTVAKDEVGKIEKRVSILEQFKWKIVGIVTIIPTIIALVPHIVKLTG